MDIAEARLASANGSRPLAPAPEPWSPPATLSETDALILMIQRAVADPTVDVEKMERLYALFKDAEARKAKIAYQAALSQMQAELPVIDENGAIKNNSGEVQSTYAYWEDINEAIMPVLKRHGFALTFRISRGKDNVPSVTGVLSHSAGHAEETTIELPFDTSGSKNAVQAVGSSTSYGKRYTASALLNLSSRNRQEDDDGQAAGGNGMSGAANAAINSIHLCTTVEEMRSWKGKNAAILGDLPQAEADAVVRHFNAHLKKLKAGAAQ